MSPFATLILRNVRLPAGSDGGGDGDAVAVAGGRVAGVGRYGDWRRRVGSDTEVVDCGGRAIVPGLVDAHCHPFAAARAADGVDCRPAATPDVPAVVRALRAAAASMPSEDRWVRGYGYDDSPVGLGRHLRRDDLDGVSTRRPVRVEHRSGHACVLNGAGLRAAGIGRNTPAPAGGVIARDGAGEPTGLLLEMGGWLRERVGTMGNDDDDRTFQASLQRFGERLLSYGVTAVTDAGAGNGPARWRAWADAIDGGAFPLRVTMMAGVERLSEMRAAGLGYGAAACGGLLRLGHAKIMLTASGGGLHPHPEALAGLVRAAHRAGYPAAIHAVERDAIVAAAWALGEAPALSDAGVVGVRAPAVVRVRDRIEHCAECPPEVAELVRQSGAQAVVNPGLLYHDGARYRATVAADLLPHLYPAGALRSLGIPVAFGSDAPVAEPNPWAAAAGAVGTGVPSVSVSDALGMHSGGRRRIAAGMAADLAVVWPDPLASGMADLPSVRAAATVVGGRLVWRDGV